MPSQIVATWTEAAGFDPTIRLRAADWPILRRKQIRAEPYSRTKLYRHMARGRPVLFSDFPSPIRVRRGQGLRETLEKLILNGFPESQKARVQVGPKRYRHNLPLPDLFKRWAAGRAIISVTDLHVRGTRLERDLDLAVLSDFNLLHAGTGEMARQEMMTLVISSRGNVTDSHSDDPDGSNHCFIGRKLWLAWDTFEGRAKGLEDLSRDTCEDAAAFDMRTFLSLSSSRWFTVAQGQTLFLPGKLTHKVITLEPYMGIGSFYVALPNSVGTLIRWNTHGPLWSLNRWKGEDKLVNEIAAAAARKVRALRGESPSARRHWGLDYLEQAAIRFARAPFSKAKARLMKNRAFADFISAAGAARG